MADNRHSPWNKTKTLLPWVGTLLLLLYLGWTTDLEAVADAFVDVNLGLLALVCLIATLTTFFTDSWCVKLVFDRFVCPITYRESLPIKATSYFLNVLNYNLALVGMAVYIQRSRQAPFWRALGSLIFLNLVDILGLRLMLAAGLALNWRNDTLEPAIKTLSVLLAAGGIGGLAFLITVCRLGLKVPLLGRLLQAELLAPLRELALPWLAGVTAVRVFFLSQYLLSQYFVLLLFGVEIPVSRLLVYCPLLTFIQIIPISISGLGTSQVVMRHFYAPYALTASGDLTRRALIDAFSTSSIFGFLIFRFLIGYLFLGKLSQEVVAAARKGVDMRHQQTDGPATPPAAAPERPGGGL